MKPAERTDWGGYSGYFADPDGHVWELAWNPSWPLDWQRHYAGVRESLAAGAKLDELVPGDERYRASRSASRPTGSPSSTIRIVSCGWLLGFGAAVAGSWAVMGSR